MIQDWITEVKEREELVASTLQTTTRNQREVATLEAEVGEATKAVLNMEEKMLENEARLARLLGDQASLRLDCLNLKRVELEKSSQLREARAVLKESEDKTRLAHTELMATLCGKALVISKKRSVPSQAAEAATATEVATAAEAATATEVAAEAATARVVAAEAATAAATAAEAAKTAEAATTAAPATETPPAGAAAAATGVEPVKFPFAYTDKRERER